MLFLDVNICVYAMRPEASDLASRVRDWLGDQLNGPVTIGVSELVLSSMTRIVTRHHVFDAPSTPEESMEFVDGLLAVPSVSVVRPGSRHWSIFRDLVVTNRLRGDAIPDAYLASLAMEHGATLVTLDRDFARFEGLRTLNPLTAAS